MPRFHPHRSVLVIALVGFLTSLAWGQPALPTHAEPGAPAVPKRPKVSAAAKAGLPLPEFAEAYDLVVYGATPAGVACAVRASREGLAVLLVSHAPQVGGLLTNGLSVMDTLYAGARSPLYDELRRGIHDYYRITYGPDSPQFAASRPGHPKTYYEAHVAEMLIEEMIAREPGITLVRGFIPSEAEIDGPTIRRVSFVEKHGSRKFVAAGRIFSDCSYEADLAVAAKVPYRVGRESRADFGEPHAGRIFLRRVFPFPPPHVDPAIIADYKKLNLFHYDRWFEIVPEHSTGEGDHKVQAYNIRAVLTTDPANRVLPDKPPVNYDRAFFADIWSKKPPYSQLLGPLPNQKYLWNMPELIGPQYDYPDGDWAKKEEITEQHRRATVGMLYYLQNDPAVDPKEQAQWRNLGFARDEFTDNNHLPYEVYARQTRRVIGRATFTEHDALLAKGSKRTPVHRDSVGVTEWFMDVHAVSHERMPDTLYEGEIYLNYLSHPAQIPFRTIVAQKLDNLLIPVCISTTHVGWGAIRLEPTWMNIAESAAHASVMAIETRMAPAKIDHDALVRRLAERRVMVSFFNDVALDAAEPWVAAVQYLGTQGFFGSYDANAAGLLNDTTARLWIEAAGKLRRGEDYDRTELSRRVLAAEKPGVDGGGTGIVARDFVERLAKATGTDAKRLESNLGLLADRPITRGTACRLIFSNE